MNKVISESLIQKRKGDDVELNMTGTQHVRTYKGSGKKERWQKPYNAGNPGKDSLFHFMCNEKFREVK